MTFLFVQPVDSNLVHFLSFLLFNLLAFVPEILVSEVDHKTVYGLLNNKWYERPRFLHKFHLDGSSSMQTFKRCEKELGVLEWGFG
jgi:hypothetical protein